MNFTLPFCHLRLVCDQNSQTTHTLTAPAHESTACDSQSTHQPTKLITIQYSSKYMYMHKKLSYRRVTARCVLSVVILQITTQQCRNYLYDKS